MKLIVGLGNIGKEYAGTRHNIGFMVADEIAKRWEAATWKKGDNAFYVEKRLAEKVFLIKPTTYMNLSGIAVGDFANFYHIEPQDILIIQDDMDLPAGFLRIRKKGSSGGHNGLKSIEQALGTQEYPRIKIGIGHPKHDEQAVITHVLQQFSTFEQDAVKEAVQKAADAAIMWLTSDINEVAQKFNSKRVKNKEKTEQDQKDVPKME
jgi:PTH1 family peptidyl-tRNA hydrolase